MTTATTQAQKVISQVTLDPTTDHLNVTIALILRDDEDFYEEQKFAIDHASVEAFLEKNGDLEGDEDREVYGRDGHANLVAVSYKIDYFNWLTDVLIDKEDTIVAYLKAAKLIPASIEYDPSAV